MLMQATPPPDIYCLTQFVACSACVAGRKVCAIREARARKRVKCQGAMCSLLQQQDTHEVAFSCSKCGFQPARAYAEQGTSRWHTTSAMAPEGVHAIEVWRVMVYHAHDTRAYRFLLPCMGMPAPYVWVRSSVCRQSAVCVSS